MGQEIERKFLVRNDSWQSSVQQSIRMRQGYLSDGMERSVRVRLENDKAFINIKKSGDGIHRHEFQYRIPSEDAETLLDEVALRPLIEKTRHEVPLGGHLWEVDVFEGDNEGLVVAEIELARADEPFDRPDWLGEEVSDDLRYYNVSLREQPFRHWKK
jgi:adenylate cyclase